MGGGMLRFKKEKKGRSLVVKLVVVFATRHNQALRKKVAESHIFFKNNLRKPFSQISHFHTITICKCASSLHMLISWPENSLYLRRRNLGCGGIFLSRKYSKSLFWAFYQFPVATVMNYHVKKKVKMLVAHLCPTVLSTHGQQPTMLFCP